MTKQEGLGETECTITEEEYVRANILFTKLSKKNLILYSISVFTLLLAYFFLDGLKFLIIGTIIGSLAGIIVVRFLYSPWQTKRQYKIYKSIQEPFTISQPLQGIHFKNDSGETTLKWNNIIKWRENKEFLLIYQSDYLYHIISFQNV